MDRTEFERYQAFMIGYVNRINKATLNVTIGGIRIGTAKYSRLAQINLKSRIITFSRFAIENVPERGRRYLVLHELAHVREANHTRRFWDIVAHYEPSYRQIGHTLDMAFKHNVREFQRQLKTTGKEAERKQPKLLVTPQLIIAGDLPNYQDYGDEANSGNTDTFECLENEFDVWDDSAAGIIAGGSELDHDTINSGASF